ncbi:galectin [Sphaerosporella brunnea]|uniref:Galectin n=1 Tax=Sphaerosporella brunnea TaxID=1250544 RepID=A0A5J5EFJ9_9PEZI|nr:galectin [Sphaerosporella brunnea]
MFYLLNLDQTVKLSQEFKPDGIIVFHSAILDLNPSKTGTSEIDNTAINLKHGNDILLHISIRRKENAVVFNSKTANGNWGAEERIVLKGAFSGPNTTITVYNHGDRFQILFDYHTVHYYNKRIQANADNVSYNRNPDQTPPFSNPLAFSTYSSLAKMVANDD